MISVENIAWHARWCQRAAHALDKIYRAKKLTAELRDEKDRLEEMLGREVADIFEALDAYEGSMH